jgi:chitodextrinase
MRPGFSRTAAVLVGGALLVCSAALLAGSAAAKPGGKQKRDHQPPKAPQGLVVTGTTPSSVSLAWQPAKDNRAVVRYGLYVGRFLVGSTRQTEGTIRGLPCDTRLLLGVDAVDAAGNRSRQTKIWATTGACPDRWPPSMPTDLRQTAATATTVSIAWTASWDNVGVVAYRVYRDDTAVADVESTSATIDGLPCETTLRLEVDAVDGAGNRSRRASMSATTGACQDTTPPSAPAALTQTGATETTASIAWTPSSDNVGVTGYRVYRHDGTVADVASTSATVDGLICGESYDLAVDAVDAAGNRSTKTPLTVSTSACPADRFVATAGADHAWTHVAATYDGDAVRLYVDGVLRSERSVPGAIEASDGPLRIGGNAVWPEFFAGQIDDVRVYDRALSALQIQADLAAPVTTAVPAPAAEGLVAAYAFDEGSGSEAKDASGNERAGTIAGAGWKSAGRNGGSLVFDGVDDWVTVGDSPTLDLTSGMTLEAWVRPSTLGTQWRTVILKEGGPGGLVYALYASTEDFQPAAHVFVGADTWTRGPGSLPENTCAEAADPCLTLDHAYRAAAPGEVVELAPGLYPGQRIDADAAKTSSDDVVFRPAPGQSVVMTGLLDVRGAHLEFRDLVLQDGGWRTFTGADDVTFRDVVTSFFAIVSSSNVRVLGGSVGPQTDADVAQIKPECFGCPHVSHVTIDGVLFHDAVLSAGSEAHVECVQVWHTEHLTIRNSRFVNCETHDVFFAGEGLPVEHVLFENNMGAAVRAGFYSLRVAADTPGEGCVDVVVRNNSSPTPLSVECDTASGVRIVANVAPLSPSQCDSRYTYRHNVWDGAECGPTDSDAPSGFLDAAGFDLHLAANAAAIGHGDPTDFPTTDIDGDPRPLGDQPDAGADERG